MAVRTSSSFFEGRTMVIATMHEKESVMAPILESSLGVRCIVPPQLDTDLLGTFSGERRRLDNPVATARSKCILAMELSGCDLAIASEGSFGPHPTFVYAPCDDEILVLVDRKNNLEIVVRELSTETNFQGRKIESEEDLRSFAEEALFPTHALMLRPTKNTCQDIRKGITDWNLLLESFLFMRRMHGGAFAETDMRAMYNPTRMRVIADATGKMVAKIQSTCPNCGIPGFGVTEAKQGLPCALCNLPTQSVLKHIYSCAPCGHVVEVKHPHGRHAEDPRYCDYCNP